MAPNTQTIEIVLEEFIELVQAVSELKSAFGAPGDFGYGTKEGKALYRLYNAQSKFGIQHANIPAISQGAPRQ